MALIKCAECGKEISDKANACPNCACPVEKKEVKITIERIKSFMGSKVVPVVYIDDKLIGNLKNGETIETKASIGEHKIILDITSKDVNSNLIFGSPVMDTTRKEIENFIIDEETNEVYMKVENKKGFHISITKK